MAVILPQSLQSDLQSSLPVLPNNGNPGGAYNMSQGEPAVKAAAPQDPYAWLQPSQYMQEVDTILKKQDTVFEDMLFNLVHPQEEQKFNLKIDQNEGRINVVPLDDYGMTMGANATDPEALEYTLPIGYQQSPQYSPILPGE